MKLLFEEFTKSFNIRLNNIFMVYKISFSAGTVYMSAFTLFHLGMYMLHRIQIAFLFTGSF